MKNPFNHPAMIDISLLLGRVILGLFVVIAGWQKMQKPGVAEFAHYVVQMWPRWMPQFLALPFGYTVPFAEILLGLSLTVGIFTRLSAGLMSLMLVSIFYAVVAQNGNITGGAPGSFHFSIVFAALAFIIAIIGPGRLALDPLYFGGGDAK